MEIQIKFGKGENTFIKNKFNAQNVNSTRS